jgi:replication factor C subunit 2/4
VELNLKRVVEGEGVKITEQAFRTLLFIADGDMRQAINNIQACHFASQGQTITDERVLHICDAPSIEEIKEILKSAEKGDVHDAVRRMHNIYEQGYSVFDIVGTIHKVLLTMENDIKRERLFEMLKFVAELKKRVL